MSRKITVALCSALLLMFGLLAYSSFQTESATIDEPLHAAGSYFHVFDHDYRLDSEDPPLWNYLAMLFQYRGELQNHLPSDVYRSIAGNMLFSFSTSVFVIYQSGNDGAAFINTSREGMLLAGLALGAVLLIWSYRIAGPASAVVAVTLFSFDPNFLAHSPLIKNDVSLSLVMLIDAAVVYALGRKITALNLILGIALICLGPLVKFSGVLVVFIALTTLWLRAILPWPWQVLNVELKQIWQRVVMVIALTVLVAGACDLAIWASYAFRFDPTPEPGLMLNVDRPMLQLEQNMFRLKTGRYPTAAEISATPLPLPGVLEQFAERHRLLPQAWLFGMLFTYASTLIREAFVLGRHYENGRWFYFPCVILFKTPVATLLCIAIALVTLAFRRLRRKTDGWLLICLLAPLTIYSFSALRTNLNLGVRHILPIYPLIYLLLALRARTLLALAPRATRIILPLLAIGLAAETLSAYPHYISFFNAPSRPDRLNLLSDSNFDWGQDLPYVAKWQKAHPDETLYLGYWCAADPAFYGIEYKNLPGGYVLRGNPVWPPTESHAALAICATLLQSVSCDPKYRPIYDEIRQHKPREILGDSIYLYDWPLK